ncbi:hypothetical protein [Leyella stercorea]|uniref:hypothetical protein n=1 Tax=Leyella stercorea TaxID=363265 RepID=UPI00242DA7BB|nr:hypothetical protein [Leyella stercorea]
MEHCVFHLRRPMRMSASNDADVCVDRCGCLRRPVRMSASVGAQRKSVRFALKE